MLKKIINRILILLSLIILSSTIWATNNFFFDNFNQVLYTLMFSVGNASKSLIKEFISLVIVIIIVWIIIVFILEFFNRVCAKNENIITIEIFRKQFKFDLLDNFIYKKVTKYIPILLLVISIIFAFNKFHIWEFINSNLVESNFFKEEYVSAEDADISFNTKKNLIYIYLESMESTFSNYELGGSYDKNYIPELIDIADKNYNFSFNDSVGGAKQVFGSGWTIAAMISQSSGVPYKVLFDNTNDPEDGNSEYENYDVFLPGAYSIGEILLENGYKNYLMVGSDSTFGGRKLYFSQHGNYEILDYYTAKEEQVISDNYYKNWGYEDEILYNYAKQKLLEISKENNPFNFTMLTVDTHAPNGYSSDFCEHVSDNTYLNSIRCASYQLNEFLSWLEKQDFYDDTAIVITGDHLSMNQYSFDNVAYDNRYVYNAFINSEVESKCTKNRRFSTLDYFPTTLAAMGANIKGNKIGLGTNLFSCEPTLLEKYDINYINDELNKNSKYYVSCIQIGDCDK
ncbi:MAG: LTA synthase family protein [Bacilli bacterium]|nr:LTA synthase family protein [Bacilli bacterium]